MTDAAQDRTGTGQRAAVLALTVPAVACGLALLLAVVGATLVTHAPDGARAQSPATFGQAVRADDLYAVFDAIRAGRNPNVPVPYRDDDHTASREIAVAPLLIAIANGRENMVMLLLSYGVTLNDPANAGAVCLASTMKEPAIVRILVRQGGAVEPARCADAPAGGLPLVVYAAASHP